MLTVGKFAFNRVHAGILPRTHPGMLDFSFVSPFGKGDETIHYDFR